MATLSKMSRAQARTYQARRRSVFVSRDEEGVGASHRTEVRKERRRMSALVAAYGEEVEQ